MTTVSQPRAARGRRAARPSGDDRELAILSTLERLLEDRPFAEISVDDLAKGAGISRPTFYFYFPSKDAVLLTLFERVIAEADATFEGRPRTTPDDPARAWRDGIYAFFEPLRDHVGVALAGVAADRDQRRDPRSSGRRTCRSGSIAPRRSSRRTGAWRGAGHRAGSRIWRPR